MVQAETVKKESLGQRIMVIGCTGSGKTTLALSLGELLRLPVIHMDKEFWLPGWKLRPEDEWIEKLRAFAAQDSWIIEGNYGEGIDFDIRFRRADSVIFLDYSRLVCLFRVLRRHIRLRGGGTVPGCTPGCKHTLSWQYVKFIWRFPQRPRQRIFQKFSYYSSVNKIILKTPKEAKKFIESLAPAGV
jgi:adenylate kinase family enzyme